MANENEQVGAAWARYRTVLAYCLIVALGATTFGFDLGETSGFLAMPQFLKDFGTFDPSSQTYGMSASRISVYNAVELIFMIVASTISGSIGSRFGCKKGLMLCAGTSLLGTALQMVSYYPAMCVGRSIMGLSIGFAGTFTVTYWTEVAPVEVRGFMVMFYQLFINISQFIGSCVDEGTNGIDTPWAYRIPLFSTWIFPILLLILIKIVPESPRWFIIHDRIDDARRNFRRVRGENWSQESLDKELDDAITFTKLEKELDSSTSYLQCFKETDLRRTLIGILLITGQQFMGVAFLSGYMTYFFTLVGFTDAFLISVITNLCSVVGVLVAFPLVRFLGRRIILIIGAGVNSFCMFAFAIISQAATNNEASARCLIAFICISVFAYAASWGPVAPIVLGETQSNKLRSKSVAIGFASGWVICAAVAISTPYLISPSAANLGTKVGFIFGSTSLAVFILTILFVPETKGRSLENIDEMFLNRISTWKFKSYVCTGEVNGIQVCEVFGEKDVKIVQTERV